MARGDEEESRRLVDSCPRHHYRMTDVAFLGRCMSTTELVLATCVDLAQHMSRLSMLDGIREMLPYARLLYHTLLRVVKVQLNPGHCRNSSISHRKFIRNSLLHAVILAGSCPS
jgi:hypothetical protein